MLKQAFKVCFSLFIVLSLLVNYSISTDSTEKYAPPASESENKSTEPTDLQTKGEQNFLDQQLASSPSVNADPTIQTKGDNNVPASPSPSIVDNSVLDTGDMDSLLRENTSVSRSNANPPAAEAKGSGVGVIAQENPSLIPTVETKGDNNSPTSPSSSVVDNSVVDTGDMDSLSGENTSVSVSNADPPAAETKERGIGVTVQENTSLPPTVETNGDNNSLTSPSPSIDDNSVLDTRDMDGISQENTSIPLSNADPPAAETKESSNEDLVQENTSLPPTVETKEEGNNVSQENTLVPSSPSPFPPAYIDTPAFETSDDGSFTQENQSPPPNTVSENPENVPQLNDYNSQPNNVVPAPPEAVSYPELDPTIQSTPSNDDTYDSAPPTSNQHTILPFNYRAEDEPVEPSQEEEDSWNRANGAVAGVLVGACVIGVGAFVYQKRKKDNVRAQYQYQCLGKKEGV